MMAPILSHAIDLSTDCVFNQAAPHPADPIKCHMSTQRTQAPKGVDHAHKRAATLDLLENSIGTEPPVCAIG